MTEEIKPERYSEGWRDYIMSQFRSDELQNGVPSCSGLRRVFEKEIGPIMSISVRDIFPDKDKFGLPMCTAVVSIDFHDKSIGQTRTVEDAADAWDASMSEDFKIYPAACSVTRAEGRVYRKILDVKVSSEEIQKDEQAEEIVTRTKGVIDINDEKSYASKERKRILEKFAKKCGINIVPMASELYNIEINPSKTWEEQNIKEADSAKMMEDLSSYNNGSISEEKKAIIIERCLINAKSE